MITTAIVWDHRGGQRQAVKARWKVRVTVDRKPII